MKIILEANLPTGYLDGIIDSSEIHFINTDNMFDNWMVVLDKYSIIIQKLYYNKWVFINTIFSFLWKLKQQRNSVYYKQLHESLLHKTRVFMRQHGICAIFTYRCDKQIKKYLRDNNFLHYDFESLEELTTFMKYNIS